MMGEGKCFSSLYIFWCSELGGKEKRIVAYSTYLLQYHCTVTSWKVILDKQTSFLFIFEGDVLRVAVVRLVWDLHDPDNVTFHYQNSSLSISDKFWNY